MRLATTTRLSAAGRTNIFAVRTYEKAAGEGLGETFSYENPQFPYENPPLGRSAAVPAYEIGPIS